MHAYARKWKLSGPALMRAIRAMNPAQAVDVLQTVCQGMEASVASDIFNGKAKLMDAEGGQVILVQTEHA